MSFRADTYGEAFAEGARRLYQYANASVEHGLLVVQASDGFRVTDIVRGDAEGIDWDMTHIRPLHSTSPVFALIHTHTNVNGIEFSGRSRGRIANGKNGDIGAYREFSDMSTVFTGVYLIHSAEMRVTHGTEKGRFFANMSEYINPD